MILSGQTIRRLGLVEPLVERTEVSLLATHVNGRPVQPVSHGLGPAGYDVRVEFDREGRIPARTLNFGNFVLASTVERFSLPTNVMGVVHDKSSWARRGLAVQNTVLEPGWSGYLTLELTCHCREGVYIPRGVGIAQVVFHFTDECVEQPYSGKYNDQQRGPQEAR